MFTGTQRRHRRSIACPLVMACLSVLGISASTSAQTWKFTNATVQAGVNYFHGYVQSGQSNSRAIATGVAAGDYDRDGWIDLFMVRGDTSPHLLLRNKGDGTFEDVSQAAGVAIAGASASGPLFADLDGDGWLDIFIGGIQTTRPVLFRNKGDGTFENVTQASGINTPDDTYSACAGDYDRDGDLDLLLAHWWGGYFNCGRLWQNQGDATFICVDNSAGTLLSRNTIARFDFTPNFADINNDGWPDILFSSDFGTSQVYVNDGDGTFTDVTTDVINDENGMGSAIGDYDDDGDLDWFVSSIWKPSGSPGGGFPLTGNRMYRNNGDGTFADATDSAGVRLGGWGWGASFADFNNDGHLDLYHVNGWPYDDPEFVRDPALLFVSNGDGTFSDSASALGANHTGQGRAVVCVDYDRDGDLDILVVSANSGNVFYRNDGGNAQNYLAVKLHGNRLNSEAIGARVYATIGNQTQLRELRAGSNFESQDPAEAHFGLGTAATVDILRIVWPDGETTELSDVPANQLLTLDYPKVAPPLRPPTNRPEILAISPNPSAGQFTIQFQLPGDVSGLLRIYDVAGRLVNQIQLSSSADPGSVSWQGTNTRGRSVAAGVYFLRVETASGLSEPRRIVIVR